MIQIFVMSARIPRVRDLHGGNGVLVALQPGQSIDRMSGPTMMAQKTTFMEAKGGEARTVKTNRSKGLETDRLGLMKGTLGLRWGVAGWATLTLVALPRFSQGWLDSNRIKRK